MSRHRQDVVVVSQLDLDALSDYTISVTNEGVKEMSPIQMIIIDNEGRAFGVSVDGTNGEMTFSAVELENIERPMGVPKVLSDLRVMLPHGGEYRFIPFHHAFPATYVWDDEKLPPVDGVFDDGGEGPSGIGLSKEVIAEEDRKPPSLRSIGKSIISCLSHKSRKSQIGKPVMAKNFLSARREEIDAEAQTIIDRLAVLKAEVIAFGERLEALKTEDAELERMSRK